MSDRKPITARSSRHGDKFPLAHEALENYGAWDRQTPQVHQERIRRVGTGYEKAPENYDEDYALQIDRAIAMIASADERDAIKCNYVLNLSAREAVDYLSGKGRSVNRGQYVLSLEAAIAKIEAVLTLSMSHRPCVLPSRDV